LANDEGDDDDHHHHRGLRRGIAGRAGGDETDLIELKIELIRTMWLQAGIIIGALSLIFGGIATLIKVL
jgi:hypothetical protein